MAETTPETRPFKDSPFSIKNLLNCESKPTLIKPKAIMNSTKGLLEHGFSLSRVGDLSLPRFDLPVQRFGLAAHWWYPYGHLHRTAGQASHCSHTYLKHYQKYHDHTLLQGLAFYFCLDSVCSGTMQC